MDVEFDDFRAFTVEDRLMERGSSSFEGLYSEWEFVGFSVKAHLFVNSPFMT